jgi:hypothetical protein
MVYSSKDKIKEVPVENPGLTAEPGMKDKMARTAQAGVGQKYPKKGFSTKPNRVKGGVGAIASQVKPGQMDTKPTQGASVPVQEAARTQDGKDVFAMKPDEWKKRQEKILGRGRAL